MNIYWYILSSDFSGLRCILWFPFPRDDASQDQLVAFYRHHVYTVSDILCVLLFRHHMVTSRRSVNQIIKRLGIRVRQNQHPLVIILRAIQHLHACGYSYMWVTERCGAFKCNTGIMFFSAYSQDTSTSCWHRSSSTHWSSPETHGVSRIWSQGGHSHRWLR